MRRSRGPQFALLALACALALLPNCGGDSSPTSSLPRPTPTPTPASRAVLSLVVEPNPVTHGPGILGRDHSAEFKLIISESAGVAGNVDSVGLTLIDGATGRVGAFLDLNPAQIITIAGTNHISAMGSLQLALRLGYTLPSGGSAGAMIVVVHFSDDRGNAIDKPLEVPIL